MSDVCRAWTIACVGIKCCKGMACKDSDGKVLGEGEGKGGSCQEASSEEIKDRGGDSATYPDSNDDSGEDLDKGIHWEDVKAKKE